MSLEELRAKLETDNPLPGMSIEPVFTAGVQGNQTDLFTVRTEEKDRQKVQDYINEHLKEGEQSLLKRVQMKAGPAQPKGDQTVVELSFFDPLTGEPDYASRGQVDRLLGEAFKEQKLDVKQSRLEEAGDSREGRFARMTLVVNDPVPKAGLEKAVAIASRELQESPQPERLENFDRQLAANTQQRALYAILASWVAILLYLWFRFGNWTFGLACVLCLVHDLFFTLGIIAGAHYLYPYWVGHTLLALHDFKIDLPAVAALLTLVGYSVNDTIVVFDRIREVRGKNPHLTPQMINDSVNQTLSRTILASLTVWLVVIVLYAVGGEGVHLFAFVMIVGVIVGTYSSIYIASPLLLIFGEGAPTAAERARALKTTAITQG